MQSGIQRNIWLVVTVLFLLLPSVSKCEHLYTVTNLGVLPGYKSSTATALNDNGDVTGFCAQDAGAIMGKLFLWQAGKLQPLPSPPTKEGAQAYGISGSNDVAVSSAGRAYVIRGGKLIDLMAEHGKKATFSMSTAANHRGDIVGMYTPSNARRTRGFLVRNGKFVDICDVSKGDSKMEYYPHAVNSDGSVTGIVQMGDGAEFPFLFKDGKLTRITLQIGRGMGTGEGINDKGAIVGQAWFDDGLHAFILQDGRATDLGKSGGTQSVATGINNRNEIVGNLNISENTMRAFVSRNGKITDLNSLIPKESGWILESAYAINNRGEIVGSGKYRGQKRAFLLSPATVQPEESPVR